MNAISAGRSFHKNAILYMCAIRTYIYSNIYIYIFLNNILMCIPANVCVRETYCTDGFFFIIY